MIIIAPKPFPLVSVVANPFSGQVNLSLNPIAMEMYGPAYPGIVRQQLENALEVVKQMEKNISK